MKNNFIKRDIPIDFVKFIAIIGVVIIHMCNYNLPISSLGWSLTLFLRSLVSASVPLFLMSSGALMLADTKDITLKKLYFKNILRIFIAMIFWGMVYKVFHMIENGFAINIKSVIESFKEVLLFDHEFHFYYMHMIIIVYVFLPVTRTLVKALDQKGLIYFLAVWFAFGICYPTVVTFYPFTEFKGFTYTYGINLTYASIGFGVLGYYLKKYPLKQSQSIGMLTFGMVLVFGLTYYMSCKTGILYQLFIGGNTVPVCILAIGIFSLCMKFKPKSKIISSSVICVSKASFLIYLIHLLVKYILTHYNLIISGIPDIFEILINSFINILICLVLYVLLCRIPLVKKYLM